MARGQVPKARAVLPARVPDEREVATVPRSGDAAEWREVHCADVEVPSYLASLTVDAALLQRVRFTAAEVGRLTATDVVFEDCELSGALLDRAELTRVEFRRCRMSGVVLSASVNRDVQLVDCRLDGANLRGASFEHAAIVECDLQGADLYGATLVDAQVLRTNLTGIDATRVRLDTVRLHGSTLADIRGAGGLAGATVSSDQVIPLAWSLVAAMGIKVDDERD